VTIKNRVGGDNLVGSGTALVEKQSTRSRKGETNQPKMWGYVSSECRIEIKGILGRTEKKKTHIKKIEVGGGKKGTVNRGDQNATSLPGGQGTGKKKKPKHTTPEHLMESDRGGCCCIPLTGLESTTKKRRGGTRGKNKKTTKPMTALETTKKKQATEQTLKKKT